MAFLRSSLIATLLCLFVLTGYTAQAFGMCCERNGGEQIQQVKTPLGETPSGEMHHCECFCHQAVATPANAPARIPGANFVSVETLRSADQFPPDSLPLGIDYPPQLG